jgi:hypothetical protein
MLGHHRGQTGGIGAFHLVICLSVSRSFTVSKTVWAYLANHFPAFDDDERRHRRDLVFLRDRLDLVDVDFQKLYVCELVEEREVRKQRSSGFTAARRTFWDNCWKVGAIMWLQQSKVEHLHI